MLSVVDGNVKMNKPFYLLAPVRVDFFFFFGIALLDKVDVGKWFHRVFNNRLSSLLIIVKYK